MSGRMGIGVIGAGVISTEYLTNLTTFPDLEVRFVADLDVDRARAQAEKFGISGHGTVADLLADPGVELVVNLTIPAVHAEVALQVIAAGKHVWSEKPLAMDRVSGREVLDAAAAAGVRASAAPDTFLGAGLQSGFRAIADGAIGTPITALTLFQSPGPESWHPSPEFLFAVGGGPLFDIGPYYLTTLIQVFGSVSAVVASASTARAERIIGSGPKAGTSFPVEVPTHVGATIWFDSGASAQSVLSFESHRTRTGFVEISGTEGTAVLPDPNVFDGATQIFRNGSGDAETVEPVGARTTRGTGVLELAQAIRADRPERASGALSYHVLDVMVALAQSAEERRIVEIDSSFEQAPPLAADWNPLAVTFGR